MPWSPNFIVTAQVDKLITELCSAVSCNKIYSLLPSQLRKTRGKRGGREREERDMCGWVEGNLFFTSQAHHFETEIMLQKKSYSIKWSVKLQLLLLERLVSQSALEFSGKAFSTLVSSRPK